MPTTGSSWIIQLLQCSRSKLTSLYLPYSCGLLQAYVMQYAPVAGRYIFMPPQAEMLPVARMADRIGIADIFGFSTFVWNVEYSLAIARTIKAGKPNALVIFGGPQVPDLAESWLREYPQIDVCVHGEGERVFLDLLESLPTRNWDEIAGISWIDQQGTFHHNPPRPRIRDLDYIPSPYLTGVFDTLLANREIDWIATWETNRGCPFSCTFCDWGSNTTSKVQRFGFERLKDEVDWFSRHRIEHINCVDANFGILPRDLEITDYVIGAKARTGYPVSFFLQGAKNVTERIYTIQKRFLQSGMHKMIDLALQAVSPDVLSTIKRKNISSETYHQLQERFHRDGVMTYTDLLVGLPGETYDSFVDGVCKIIDEGQHNFIIFHNVILLPNAEMAQPESRLKYGLQSVRVPCNDRWYGVHQEVPEFKEMVIATHSLSLDDWCRIRAFGWWVLILYYFFKLLQLPLLILNKQGGLPWRTLFEFFSEARFEHTPMLADLHGFLLQKARSIQQGDSEYCILIKVNQPVWVDIDDFVLHGLSKPDVAKAFYAEARLALRQLAESHRAPGCAPLQPGLLAESLQLSEALFLCPILQQPFMLPGRYNLWDWYQGVLRGEPVNLSQEPCHYVRNWFSEPYFEVRVEKGIR